MTETKRATANQSVDRSAETTAEESVLGKARERANLALMRTRESADALADRAADQVESTPLAAVVGGVAVGAIAGLLLPKTQQEVQLLGSLGQKINEGAISAAKAAGEASHAGWIGILNLVIALSVVLGVFNLLPVPMLDGGHLAMYLYEAVRGKPLSLKAQELGLRVGFALVIGMALVATFNDIRLLLK